MPNQKHRTPSHRITVRVEYLVAYLIPLKRTCSRHCHDIISDSSPLGHTGTPEFSKFSTPKASLGNAFLKWIHKAANVWHWKEAANVSESIAILPFDPCRSEVPPAAETMAAVGVVLVLWWPCEGNCATQDWIKDMYGIVWICWKW